MALKNIALGVFVAKIENMAIEYDARIQGSIGSKAKMAKLEEFYMSVIKEAEGSWKRDKSSKVFDIH